MNSKVPSKIRNRCLAQLAALALLLAWAGAIGARAAEPPAPHHVVYHLDDSARAIAAIRNLNNHLKAVPGSKLVVVALGAGVDFLLSGAKDDRGNPYEPMVDDLILAGVEFRVCNNTLVARQIDRARVLAEVGIVESGVAEISRLQLTEHFAYIKP
jgi:intracellular sulfur oxidation DsrE/DsrF family protein